MKNAKKKAPASPRSCDRQRGRHPTSPISDLEDLRQAALLEIGNAMFELIPQAAAAASKGKPAALRLISRWFRMPQQEKTDVKELRLRAERAERRAQPPNPSEQQLRAALQEAQHELTVLQFKYGLRQPDDSPTCLEALGQRHSPANPTITRK